MAESELAPKFAPFFSFVSDRKNCSLGWFMFTDYEPQAGIAAAVSFPDHDPFFIR